MYCKDLKLKQDSVKSSFSQSSFNFSRSSFQGWSRAPLAPQNKHPMQHRRTWVSLDPSRFGLLFLAWNSAISTVYSMIACAMFLDSDLQWRTYHINIYIYICISKNAGKPQDPSELPFQMVFDQLWSTISTSARISYHCRHCRPLPSFSHHLDPALGAHRGCG